MKLKRISVLALVCLGVMVFTGCSKIQGLLPKKTDPNKVALEAAQTEIEAYKEQVKAKDNELAELKDSIKELENQNKRILAQLEENTVEEQIEEKVEDTEQVEEVKKTRKDEDSVKKTVKKPTKEYVEPEIKSDTIAVRLKTGEQYSSTYIPFWSEDSKGISVALAELLLANNENENWSGGFEKQVEELEKHRNNGSIACTIKTLNDGSYKLDNWSPYNWYFVTLDEYKQCLEQAKAANIALGAYQAEKYKGKRISFDLLEKLIVSDPISTFTGVKIDEWKENGMQSVVLKNAAVSSSTVYTLTPSSKEPEISE